MHPRKREQHDPTDDGSVSFISLTQGMIAVVDSEDFERLNRFNWCATWEPRTKSFYAVRWSPHGKIAMAREVLKLSRGSKFQVDHIDHCTLDNRKCNLRKLHSNRTASTGARPSIRV